MSYTVSLITTSREQLFELCRMIVASIDPELLKDPANPIIISVRGSKGGGKKIFPDAAREALLGPDARFRGKENFDEFWIGSHDNEELEIDFINAAFNTSYHRSYAADTPKNRVWGISQAETLQNFLMEREFGGITFIHNSNKSSKKAGIDICLEHDGALPVTYAFSKMWRSGLKKTFNALAAENKWVRFVRIQINNEALLSSPIFQKLLESLTPKERAPAVFGISIPRA